MGNNTDIIDLYGGERLVNTNNCCGQSPYLVKYPKGRISVYCSECDRISIPASCAEDAIDHWNEWMER